MIKVGLFLLVYAMCVLAKEKASLDIVVYELTSDGGWYNTFSTNINGNFSVAGKATPAEGPLYQMHPSGLCNIIDDEDIIEYGWIGVVRMEDPRWAIEPCGMSLFLKIQHAMQRGAAAMIIDITEDPHSAIELRESGGQPLAKPIVLLNGHSAEKLMQIVKTNKQAHARIQVEQVATPVTEKEEKKLPVTQATLEQESSSTMMDMGIFIGCFVLFCIICVVIILKFKFRQQDRQGTIVEQAQSVVSKFKTHPYVCKNPPRPRSRSSDVYSLDSNSELCAICIEEYKDGQELIVLPCSHEFHKKCVYSWLVEQQTCPLCVHNILEHSNSEKSCSRPHQPSPPHSIINLPLQSSRNYNGGTGSESLISLPAQIKVTRGANAVRMTVVPRALDDQSLSSGSYTSHKSRIYKKRSSSNRDHRTNRSEHVALLHLDRHNGSDTHSTVGTSTRNREKVVHFYRDRSDERSSERQNRREDEKAQKRKERGKESKIGFTKGAINCQSKETTEKYATEGPSVRLKERPVSDTFERCQTCQYCRTNYETPERTCSEKDLQAEFNQPLLPSSDCCDNTGSCDCHVDSNQSTYGSSDTVPSDISSCDSNVYSAYCEKEFKDSSTQVKGLNIPPLQPVHLKPQCFVKSNKPSGSRTKHLSNKPEHRLSDSSGSSYENELHLRSLVQRAFTHRMQHNLYPPYTDAASCDIPDAMAPPINNDASHGLHDRQCCNTRSVLPGIYSPYDLSHMQSFSHQYGGVPLLNPDSGVTFYERRAFVSAQPEHRSQNYCSMLAEQLRFGYCRDQEDTGRSRNRDRPRRDNNVESLEARPHRCTSSRCKKCQP